MLRWRVKRSNQCFRKSNVVAMPGMYLVVGGEVIRGKENRSYYEIVSAYTAVKMGKDEFQRMSLSTNATIE